MAKKKSFPNKFILGVLLLAMAAGIVWYMGPENLSTASVVDQITDLKNKITHLQASPSSQPAAKGQAAYKFALLSDSHEDTHYFPAIADQIEARTDIDFVVDLGDLSNAGEKAKLEQAKSVLDKISAPVYVVPGDHDLNWYPKHDLTNFKQVFGRSITSYSFDKGDQHFIILDNSDLNDGIDPTTWSWLKTDLGEHANKQIYVFMSTPVSNPYLAFKAMGSQSDTVKTQAGELAELLKSYQVKATFAGDTHTFSQYKDEATGLPIVTVGASGSTKNPLPMYVVVEIYSDGSYNVTSIPTSSGIPVQGND